MTAPWIDHLLDNPEQPIEDVMVVIYAHGVDPVLNALFDEGVRVQNNNPDRAVACVRLIDRIQARIRPI